MGMRLAGEAIKHKDKVETGLDAAVFGSSYRFPVTGNPLFVIYRQTTGGYTKIATVIRADLPKSFK